MRRQINEKELALLYMAIGRTVWNLQYFEDVLVSYVTMKLKLSRPISPEDAYMVFDKERRKPLGPTITTAVSGNLIPKKYEVRFRKFVDERNWLIHRSWHQNGEDLYVDEKRFEFIERVNRLHDESNELKMFLYHEMKQWLISKGVNMNEVNRIADEKIKKLRGS
jgi:hypothetical protein